MNRQKIIFVFSILILFLSAGYVQSVEFHGRASNSVYSYEDTSAHTKLYQYVTFSLEQPEWNFLSLNASFRALTDANETLENEDRFKAYNFNLKFKRLFNRLDFVLGRQFLHPGTVLGGLDGVFTKFYITNQINISAYGGVEAHFQRSWKIYNTEDSFVTGGMVELNRMLNSNFQLFYLRKANEDAAFWHLAGLNLKNCSIPKTQLNLQTHYDLEN